MTVWIPPLFSLNGSKHWSFSALLQSQRDAWTQFCLTCESLWIKALVKWINVNVQCLSLWLELLRFSDPVTCRQLSRFSSSQFICPKQFPAEEATSKHPQDCKKKQKKKQNTFVKRSLTVPSCSDQRAFKTSPINTKQRQSIYQSVNVNYLTKEK